MKEAARTYNPGFVFPVTITAALSPMLWGYILGEVSPTQEYLIRHIYPEIPLTIMYFTVAIRNIGAMVGAFVGGAMTNTFGPRKAMMISDVLGAVASIFRVIPNVYSLILGRFLGGIYTGLNCVFVPYYIGQYSPVEVKGITGPFSSTFDGLGCALANIIGLMVPPGDTDPNNHWWQVVFLIGGVFPAIRFCILYFVFKSDPPISLIQNGKEEEAKEVFRKIYLPERAEEEYKQTIEALNMTKTSTNSKISYGDMFTPHYRMALFVGCFVISQVQTTGFQFVQSYATFIFKSEAKGPTDYAPRYYSIMTAMLAVISSIFTAPLVKKFGRRMMMLGGQTAMALWDLVFIILIVWFPGSPFTIPTVMIAFVSYFITLSPVKWIYLSDILPAPGLAIANLCNFTTSFVVTQVSPMIMDNWGIQWTYFMFFLACCGGFLFAKFVVKETKGLSHFETLTLYCPPELLAKELKDHEDAAEKSKAEGKAVEITQRDKRKTIKLQEFLNNRVSLYGERMFIPTKLHAFVGSEQKRKSVLIKVPHTSNSLWIAQAAKKRESLPGNIIPLLSDDDEEQELEEFVNKAKNN